MKKIAIIGAGGRMGSWFIEYLLTKKNFQIKAYDKNIDSVGKQINLKIETDFNSCVKDSDIVVLCVPIRIIPRMIIKCSKIMKRNSVLVDISSIKNKSFQSLNKIEDYILPICIHPMFGPGASSKQSNLKVLFIPIRDYKREMQFVQDLFQNFNILSLENAIQHDRIMAIILGLTHYINMVFADIIGSQQYKALECYSGSTFKMQCIVLESILNDDPKLLNSLFMDNPFIKKEIKHFHKKFMDYYKIINDKDDKKLLQQLQKIKSSLEKHHNLNSSYLKMYKVIDL
ncbi:MAG TPA: prephenate dehydrogenase/arogenate dehydrogenase family protein, partial [Nitrososphaeraceae archaeon]|nr:prephenate dehydrogenase/arogenate dehydrogenase family protein [Nitrososphaeraceae archaeon]